MMLIVLGLIIAVAAFNVASNISVAIFDKNKDIVLFTALGMTRSTIMAVFLIQTLILAVTGLVLGALVGVGVATQATNIVELIESFVGFQVINPEIYFIDHLPTQFKWNDLFIIVIVTLCISLAATYYPAYRAIKASTIEFKEQN